MLVNIASVLAVTLFLRYNPTVIFREIRQYSSTQCPREDHPCREKTEPNQPKPKMDDGDPSTSFGPGSLGHLN
jgi:hypothetical protein